MQSDIFEVQISFPDAAGAEAMARALVAARLAACGQVSDIRSVYRWQGAVEAAPEALLTLKTTRPCLAPLAARVREGHPYELPQITALPIAWGARDYLDWIVEACEAP